MSASIADMRPRIFVSSVVQEFQEFREAARNGVEGGGGEPVLVNEDFPAVSDSSRNACLDAIDSCDAYLVVVGSRGGWTAPSGLTVTEEEYEHARGLGMPILAFLLDEDRDSDAERLASRVSDYVEGQFRKTVKKPEDLRIAVESATRELVRQMKMPVRDKGSIQRVLAETVRDSNETLLRFVIGPERVGELVDPLRLGTPEFEHLVMETGHRLEIGLLSFRAPKTATVEIDYLELEQGNPHGRTPGEPRIRIRIQADGLLSVEQQVTGVSTGDRNRNPFASMSIVASDVREGLLASFRFTSALLEALDPHQRYQRFVYGVALANLEHRTWVEEEPTGGPFPMRYGEDRTVLAFEEPRTIPRQRLKRPESEVERAVTLFQRRLGSKD